MLITTEARAIGRAPVKDMSETLHRLNAAQRQQEAFAKLAQGAGAQEADEQISIAAAVKVQNQGIQGATGLFPQLSVPHLILASPTGIEATTKGSTHLASDQHTALTTGQGLSVASGGGFFVSVKQAIRIFVHKAGMRLVAAAGDIDMRALSDSVNLLAKLNITQTANRISISAKEEVVINGGGSYAKFNSGGIEQGTTGTFVAHASRHSLPGPNSISVPSLEEHSVDGSQLQSYDEQFRLVSRDGGIPIANKRYRITASDGNSWEGISDSDGFTERVYTDSASDISLTLLADEA
jgi:type VI secretion system secreted protein VgrG